jgi:hypothetical protein
MSSADWVVAATDKALARLLDHVGKVGLANTEEFTFRSFFVGAAHDLLEDPRHDDSATLIEFKYYLLRRTLHLDGTCGRLQETLD